MVVYLFGGLIDVYLMKALRVRALTLVVQIYPGLVVLESSVKSSLGVQALADRAWFGRRFNNP